MLLTCLSVISRWIGVPVFWLSIATYLVQHCVCAYYYRTQNLKKRYGAKWALVTGSSSGIGKALASKLARQGLSVVVVALDDALLADTCRDLQDSYPQVEIRKVGVDLGAPGYMEAISKSTQDIDVQVVFCNAGYVLTGFFHSRSMEELQRNLECNALSAVHITHHFLKKLVSKQLKGCFVYTSSASAVMPSPFSVQYAATKAFLSMFALSLAGEVKDKGIDVLAVHPSPVASRFYDKAHKLDAMDFFKKFAVPAEALPDTIFASLGRTIWRDIGATAVVFRLMSKILDLNFLFTLACPWLHTSEDFQRQSRALAEAEAKKS